MCRGWLEFDTRAYGQLHDKMVDVNRYQSDEWEISNRLFLRELPIKIRSNELLGSLPVIQWHCAIAPDALELIERKSIGVRRFIHDEIDEALGNLETDRMLLVFESLAVEHDEILASAKITLVEIVKSKLAEFAVHLEVEVANEEMGPKLVEDLHFVWAV